VDVRVIAATSVDLQKAAEAGHFRQDLFMVLGVAQIDVPALRERSEDILMLAERYLAHFSREHHRQITGFTKDASFVLKTHLWLGNIRELRNVIERAVLICESDMIGLEHLPADLLSAEMKNTGEGGYQVGDLVPLETIEMAHIRRVLASAKSIRRAAAILGCNASALCRRLKRVERMESDNDDKSAE
jgi:NtrC-family two-component system response regulator AlgB